MTNPYFLGAAFALMVLSSAMNIASTVKLNNMLGKVSDMFCIEGK